MVGSLRMLKGQSKVRITKLNHIEYYPDELRQSLGRLGEYVEYDDEPSREQAVERLADTDVAIVEWCTPVDRDMLRTASARLRHIVVPLTDYTHIDIDAARDFGVTVANCPDTTTIAVAEHLFALLGAINRKLVLADRLVREGKRDYYAPFMATELYGKTLGILGLGNIGKWAAKIGLGYGMRVIAHSRTPKGMPNVRDVELDFLLGQSDVLFVTASLNPTSAGMLSRDKLSLMKPSSFLISIAVRGILDELTLFDLLETGQIAGAGLDQLEETSPLVGSEKVVLSPGTAWLTEETFDRLFATVFENVRSFVDEDAKNIVN
jgi:glycerate dehydrogenase